MKTVAPTAADATNTGGRNCLYLTLAVERDCRFVTADERFVRELGEGHKRRFRGRVIGLVQAAGELGRPSGAIC